MDVVEREQLSPQQAFGHWYYQAKFALLLKHLRGVACLRPGTRLADVGCGMGLFLSLFEREGSLRPDQLVGIDPAHPRAVTAVGGRSVILPAWPEDEAVDVALLMDVLEHTPDDLAVLRETAGHVEKGGYVFITVPAFSWLRSMHDRFLGHFRRYSCGSLRRLVERCPELEIVELHYYYAGIFPAAVPWRLARRNAAVGAGSDMRRLPGWLNALLRRVTLAELSLASRNRVAGLTAVALCRKTTPAACHQKVVRLDPAPAALGLAA